MSEPQFLNPDGTLGAPEGQGWEEVSKALPPLGVLSGLNDDSLTILATYGKYQLFPQDTIVIQENSILDVFYVVISGKLEVFTEINFTHMTLAYAEPGECLGEVSLLEPGPATASVRAREEAMLWSMGLQELRNFLSEHVSIGGSLLFGMAHCLAQRLRHVDSLILKSQLQPNPTIINRTEPPITAAKPLPVPEGFFESLKRSMGGRKNPIK